MAKVYIESEGVITVGEELKKNNQSIEDKFKKLSKKVEKLPEYWKGSQSNKDNEKFKIIKNQFIKDACIVIDDYSKTMAQIAKDYILTEKENEKLICESKENLLLGAPNRFVDYSSELRNKFK